MYTTSKCGKDKTDFTGTTPLPLCFKPGEFFRFDRCSSLGHLWPFLRQIQSADFLEAEGRSALLSLDEVRRHFRGLKMPCDFVKRAVSHILAKGAVTLSRNRGDAFGFSPSTVEKRVDCMLPLSGMSSVVFMRKTPPDQCYFSSMTTKVSGWYGVLPNVPCRWSGFFMRFCLGVFPQSWRHVSRGPVVVRLALCFTGLHGPLSTSQLGT